MDVAVWPAVLTVLAVMSRVAVESVVLLETMPLEDALKVVGEVKLRALLKRDVIVEAPPVVPERLADKDDAALVPLDIVELPIADVPVAKDDPVPEDNIETVVRVVGLDDCEVAEEISCLVIDRVISAVILDKVEDETEPEELC